MSDILLNISKLKESFLWNFDVVDTQIFIENVIYISDQILNDFMNFDNFESIVYQSYNLEIITKDGVFDGKFIDPLYGLYSYEDTGKIVMTDENKFMIEFIRWFEKTTIMPLEEYGEISLKCGIPLFQTKIIKKNNIIFAHVPFGYDFVSAYRMIVILNKYYKQKLSNV